MKALLSKPFRSSLARLGGPTVLICARLTRESRQPTEKAQTDHHAGEIHGLDATA